MPEKIEAPLGLTSADGAWTFSIDADGHLELRSNSDEGAGDLRVVFDRDSGQVFVGSPSDPASIDVVSAIHLYDGGDVLRLRLSGDEPILEMLDSDGEVVVSLGDLANLRLGADGNHGDIAVMDDDGNRVIHMDGNHAVLRVGAPGNEGDIIAVDGSGREVFHLNSASAWLRVGSSGNEGDIEVQDGAGRRVMHMDGNNAVLRVGAQGNEGDIIAIDESGREVFHVNASAAWLRIGAVGNEGDIEVQDASGRRVMHMDGNHAVLRVGASGNEGDIIAVDGSGREVFHVNAASAWMRVGGSGNEGDIEVQDGAGRRVMHMDGNHAVLRVGADGNEGDVIVKDGSGNETIHLNGDTGDIILRNADAAEDFTLAEGVKGEPGTVMVITDSGDIAPSSGPYDTRVVGVVAGAGNYKPGLVMDRRKELSEPRAPISIMGKVTCKADATHGAIKAGDMLTTSPTTGTAMKASDPLRAFGAVIGKALTPLADGVGDVDMLITMR